MPAPHHPHQTTHRPGAPVHHPAVPRPLWRVINQSFDTRYVAGSDPVSEWTVYFETRSLARGQVTIGAELYTPDAVAAAIEPLAATIEHIAELKAHEA